VNGHDAQIARHESLHATASFTYGRRLDGILRWKHGGVTSSFPDEGGGHDIARLGVEAGIITIVPFLNCAEGAADDLRVVEGLVLAGVPLSAIWSEASMLLEDPTFRRRARAVEFALYEHTLLSGEETELIIAAA
jgi:hypothetical protein